MGEVVGSLLLVLARRRGEVRLLEGCDKEDRAKESEGDNETLRFFSMVVVVAVVVVVVLVVVVFWRALDRGVVSLGGGCVANNDEEDACELSSKGVVGTRKLVRTNPFEWEGTHPELDQLDFELPWNSTGY